ncbi:hypothetical protein GJV85_12455 [Sulfurimonas aquatica]|uniref:Uncharacterized protein n=1 Tax=Sulfurimonas aquatica TaxID=2672570 RepID=A0A975B2G4_9BACT|nr:hypothetical protein [Sulfurimonas aquatica]QSZ42885.1 hypothetical protein GJV85_12455 [Sulfurimonas aquatica]
MNNFEAKYIKISLKYLDDKLKNLHISKDTKVTQSDKKASTLNRFVAAVFKK